MDQLAGKAAVVTGASAGIGLAIAKRFGAEGARLFLTGRDRAALEAAAASIGPDAAAVAGDASSVADIERLAEVIRAAGTGIDVLVANAGRGAAGLVADMTEEKFDAAADLTFKGTYFTVSRLIPLLRDGGSIVLIGSIAGGNGTAGSAVYNASKAAVRSLARSLTAELGPRGIRANALSPGPTQTAGFDRFAEQNGPGWLERVVADIPLGRVGQPEEVASAALFLASDQASFISGVELVHDGGLSQV